MTVHQEARSKTVLVTLAYEKVFKGKVMGAQRISDIKNGIPESWKYTKIIDYFKMLRLSLNVMMTN